MGMPRHSSPSWTGASDLYFDRVSQINMAKWSQGRVALFGDAAFCVSLLAGQGSALAMTAAYVFAGELAQYRNGTKRLSADTKSTCALYRKQTARRRALRGGLRSKNPMGPVSTESGDRLCTIPGWRGSRSAAISPTVCGFPITPGQRLPRAAPRTPLIEAPRAPSPTNNQLYQLVKSHLDSGF